MELIQCNGCRRVIAKADAVASADWYGYVIEGLNSRKVGFRGHLCVDCKKKVRNFIDLGIEHLYDITRIENK